MDNFDFKGILFMFARKSALTQILVLVLFLLSAFNIQSCTQRLSNKPENLFEMPLEELMEVEVIVVSNQHQQMSRLLIPPNRISGVPWSVGGASIQKTDETADFFEMSLEELMEIETTPSVRWL